ncbi:chondroitin sulfate proteoglycan 4-like isoform X2 [Crotalus tigris]|uniref:chondroitin sulfate proteoglycan 4-like isoform X2 n=1 Tax=Crotalus tigris TaxID=88082 RepID=UPI00192F9EE0|nr:chondroitin sulfate proteoglycan 4-like isoform X2 [Crotalus tigris]
MAPGWCSRTFLLLLLVLAKCRETLAASFYGESYIQLNVAEAVYEISLRLRFQTNRPDGLLFLASGKEDYFLVELNSGNIQVRINFHTNEQILHSQLHSQVDDLDWHLLEIHHERENITLVIDKNYQTSAIVPDFLVFELNIEYGLYIGGRGNLNVYYLNNTPVNFRGCINDVIFNNHDILTSLRSSARNKNIHEVSLSCSNEFFAGEEEPINFFNSKSYVSFPLWNVQAGGILEYSVQTTAQRGLLLYSSGPLGDFVAMEIENGLIKAHIRMGKNRLELSSLSPVNDNQWHVVRLKFSIKYVELTLEKKTVQTPLPSHSRLPVLKGALYVGGINDALRAEVLKQGLASVSGRYGEGGSFRGCLKDLIIDSQKKSLKNVLVTKDISVGCTTPTEKQAVVGTVTPKLLKKESHDHFLFVNNLIVPEGGQAFLGSKHIKVSVDFKALGIRQSQIIFRIKHPPSYGQLRLNVVSKQEDFTFTMLDLWQGKVLYVHDGSEENYDYFTFSVSTSSKRKMPPYFQGNDEHMFTITVRPINDAPELIFPNGNLFPLLEYSKKCLSIDSINIVDNDTSAADLSITVLGNSNADAGFLENSKTPGKTITTFSYEDLQHGNVFFVHTGIQNSRIVLRASDGEKVSNTVVLRVMAVPLDYKLVNNTGVDVIQGTTVLITLSHLATEIIAFQQELEIKYEITEEPFFGEIQRRHTGGEWKKTNSFSQRSIERGRVRYLSTFKAIQQDNVHEHFKFKIIIGSNISQEFLFAVRVKWLTYNLLKYAPLVIDKSEREHLNSSNLLVMIPQMDLSENEFLYKLQSLPEKGRILLDNVPLQINSSFSQQNISDCKVEYQLYRKSHEESLDSFRFFISTQYVVSNIYDFKIKIKTNPQNIILINNGLTVTEGEGSLITKSELFVQTFSNMTFEYKVTKSPQHGKLMLINFSDSPESNNNLSSFTNQDIYGERLMYIHDNSETQYDEIHIAATAIKFGEEALEKEFPLSVGIKFNISIHLKNDEKPVRVVDKIFHVVKNGRKLLTLDDLCYHDPDTDFDDNQLLYTRRGIPNGDLVLVNETSHRLYQFKQEDLMQKQVLFVHQGASYGRFVLFVTDGKHYTSSLLEVSASEPYVLLANNTGLLIQKGKEAVITTTNLSATTNQDIRSDHEIRFEIFFSPKYGQIFVNNLALATFTQHDLKMEHVTYKHDDSNNLIDTLNFTVYAKGLRLDVEMNIQIYLENHQHPPVVLHNHSLLVEEGNPVQISNGKLLAVHENSLPSEIEFKVRSSPVYGYLWKFTSKENYLGAEENPVLSFTQQDINDGIIQYIQTISNQLQDHFSLDVTNGIQTVSGIGMTVAIIPKLIPLEVHNFTVAEGGSKVLKEDILKISNSHFEEVNCDFDLVEPPKHGQIANSHFFGMVLTKFTRKQVEHGLIFYVHDDSEQMLDNFTIVANCTQLWKQSLPQIIFVTITPVNDEAPIIKRNIALRVWVGSVTEITTNELLAEDKDSSPAELLYSVSPPNNGHLALKSSPSKSILNFTQAHIEEGQVVLVHRGSMSGGFSFQVTDGINFAPRQIFSITARNLVIRLENNNGLEVFPGSRKPITSHNLKAVTNEVVEVENRTITFTVANSPKLGRLIRIFSENNIQDISSFTQSMVDEGLIIYEHSDKQSTDWNIQDYFTFTVSFPPATLGPQVFHINISYEIRAHDQSSQLFANTGAVVQEGGKVLIDKTKLDGSNLLSKLPQTQRSAFEVWYEVVALPQHGRIVVGERNITRDKPHFSQYIINKFGITYVHDDSESLTDHFIFAVWLNEKSKSAVKPNIDVLEEAFNITVVPVNDQVPKLKSKLLCLNVLQGDRTVLGQDSLNVEDLDNSPEEIKYTIITDPQNGHLALWSRLNESIKDFTQADINDGSVWFVQDGSPLSGAFYFSVTDGQHRPQYKLFRLDVIPLSITLINLTEVVLLQGQDRVVITNVHLSATTNGKNPEIMFEVTKPFRYGNLLIENEQVIRFHQRDLYAARLLYCMTDFTAFGDMLEFAVFTPDSNLTGQVLKILVQPLLQMALNVTILNGMSYQLNASYLDATQLANLTKSNPQFEVIMSPVYGSLSRRSLSNTESKSLVLFTKRDIDMGVIFLETSANMTNADVLNDSFSFILRADNIQPAIGEFHFVIMRHDPSLVQVFTPKMPFLTTADILESYITENEYLFIPNRGAHTDVPAQTFRPDQNHWEHQKDRQFDEDNTRGISVWAVTTIKTQSESSWLQTPSTRNWLIIIIPLSSMTALFIIIAIVLCIFLMCHRSKKAKPLILEQPPVILNSSSFSPERSLTIPTVTVTPLLKSTDKTSVLPFMSLQREQRHPVPATPAPAVSLLQNTWSSLDPEIIQYCRKTHPTLKCNQYWV